MSLLSAASIHLWAFYVYCAVGAGVFVIFIIALLRFPVSVEILWTIVPFVLIVLMSIPATKILYTSVKTTDVRDAKYP